MSPAVRPAPAPSPPASPPPACEDPARVAARRRRYGVGGAAVLLLSAVGLLLPEAAFPWWDSLDNTASHDFYLELVAGIMSPLHDEVLVVGVFLVLLTQAGSAMLGTKQQERDYFLKTITLLFFVILFSSYYAISFELESQGTTLGASADAEAGRPFLPIVMLPLDLIMISVNAGLMVLLADDRVLADLLGHDGLVPATRTFSKKLRLLLSLSATWHLMTVLWWVAFCLLGGASLALKDMAYHGLFAGLHLLGVPLVERLCRGREGARIEWLALGYYCLVLGTCYVTRMYAYLCREMVCG